MGNGGVAAQCIVCKSCQYVQSTTSILQYSIVQYCTCSTFAIMASSNTRISIVAHRCLYQLRAQHVNTSNIKRGVFTHTKRSSAS